MYTEKAQMAKDLIEDRDIASTVSCLPFSMLLSSFRSPNASFLEIDDSDSDDESPKPLSDLPYESNPISLAGSVKLNQEWQANWGFMSSGEKLLKLRLTMKQYGIAVYIVPSEDEHQSEYTGLSDKRREFISGFSGSAGVAVITLDDAETLSGEAALSTDGRYFLQAEKELDSKHWTLLKQGVTGYPSWKQFAIDKAMSSKFTNVISCDPKLCSLSDGEYFNRLKFLQYKNKFEFKPLIEPNLIDVVWGPKKPRRPLTKVYELPLKYSGESTNDKLKRIREKIGENSVLIVSALDDIAWLFNLRSDGEIPFNPFSLLIL